jgi:hypothetical protein
MSVPVVREDKTAEHRAHGAPGAALGDVSATDQSKISSIRASRRGANSPTLAPNTLDRGVRGTGSEGLATRTGRGLKATIPATTGGDVALYPSAGLPATTPQQPQPPAPSLPPELSDRWQRLQNQRFAGVGDQSAQ